MAFTNTADLNWNSLLGAPGGSRVYNDGAQENWTADRSTTTRNAATATITKRGPAGPIRIGDVVTYSIDATVPANTVAWYPVFTDTMNQRGTSYVSSSATITTRANPPATPATLGGSSTPTVTTSAPSNRIFTWNLPGPIDNSGNPLPYAFTLTFQAQVTGNNAGAWDYWAATNTQSVSDSASFRWRDVSAGGPTTNQTANSGSVATSVRQPRISATKTILTPGPLAGGSWIDYQVVLANSSGYNTAYDVSVTDTFPVEVSSATLATATLTGVGSILPSATTDFSHLPTSAVTFDSGVSLGTTQTITLVYHCQLAPTAGAGVTLVNNADANWSSEPGAVAGERVYNDSAQETGWTNDTTSVSTSTPLATFSKTISGATTGTIGSAVVYSLNTTIPANETAYSLVVTDTVPDYLTVVAANASLPGALTVGTPGAAGTLVTYNGGDLAGSATPTTVTVTLLCQVRDNRYSGPAVPSGAISNSALLAWRTRTSGGT
ncbi:MAG: isopeptide-forming domain-containing fimbrial protein, partial [Actinomycetota bacterium]|nr:isopeptide-forming domain-containing fimbrial protein [Actinomycetota bacterium]